MLQSLSTAVRFDRDPEPTIYQPRIQTQRLVLEPVTAEIARAVIAGDLSALQVVDGWPHDDTADAMSIAAEPDAGLVWLITLGGQVIGDCGTSGPPNESGEVEIGYGLATPCRGRGYATEAAGAVCRWLLTQAEVARIRADGVRADNFASRQVLERLGFTLSSATDQSVSYTLTHDDLR